MTTRIALVVSDFNEHITSRLKEGALHYLVKNGVAKEAIEVFHVPGAFEIPVVAKRLAETGKFSALVCLGCVIRGETVHFDHVCRAASEGIRTISLATGTPIGFGVIMAKNAEQALDRAGGSHGNRGEEAARAALGVAKLFQAI